MDESVEEAPICRHKQLCLVSWQKILEEQRRLKREQEEADTASRRHTGIVPTHHQFITNERFGDLLNITDNTEKRKSGVEVKHRPACVCYPSASRKEKERSRPACRLDVEQMASTSGSDKQRAASTMCIIITSLGVTAAS